LLINHFGLVSDFLSECWSRLRDQSRIAKSGAKLGIAVLVALCGSLLRKSARGGLIVDQSNCFRFQGDPHAPFLFFDAHQPGTPGGLLLFLVLLCTPGPGQF
jgi:hypothetical protein